MLMIPKPLPVTHVAFCSADESNIPIMDGDETLKLSVMEGPVLSSTPQKPRCTDLTFKPNIRKCTRCTFTTRNSSTMTCHRPRQHTQYTAINPHPLANQTIGFRARFSISVCLPLQFGIHRVNVAKCNSFVFLLRGVEH